MAVTSNSKTTKMEDNDMKQEVDDKSGKPAKDDGKQQPDAAANSKKKVKASTDVSTTKAAGGGDGTFSSKKNGKKSNTATSASASTSTGTKSPNRPIPSYKKPDAALTFPEKVRAFHVHVQSQYCRSIYIHPQSLTSPFYPFFCPKRLSSSTPFSLSVYLSFSLVVFFFVFYLSFVCSSFPSTHHPVFGDAREHTHAHIKHKHTHAQTNERR